MLPLIQTILGKESTRRIIRKTSAVGVAVAFKLFKKGSRWRMTMWFFVTLPG
jgi:hypothetical protein